MVAAGVLSVGLSVPALRVSGDYLVIASIGFQLGILHVIGNIEATGATGGLSTSRRALEGPHRSVLDLIVVAAAALFSVGDPMADARRLRPAGYSLA